MLRGARRLGRPALAAAAALAGHPLCVRPPTLRQRANLDGPIPAKLDDPEANAAVLAAWRARIQAARDAFAKHDAATAERELKAALEEAAHFGAQSAPVATSLLNLAQLYRRSKRYDEAEPLLRRAFTVLEMHAGPHNKVTLTALVDLAELQLERGAAAAAAETFDDALARLSTAEAQQAHGAAPPARCARAACCARRRRSSASATRRAEAHLKEALALSEERWAPTRRGSSRRAPSSHASRSRNAASTRPPPGASARAPSRSTRSRSRASARSPIRSRRRRPPEFCRNNHVAGGYDTQYTPSLKTQRHDLGLRRRGAAAAFAIAFATAGRFAFAAAGRFGGELPPPPPPTSSSRTRRGGCRGARRAAAAARRRAAAGLPACSAARAWQAEATSAASGMRAS